MVGVTEDLCDDYILISVCQFRKVWYTHCPKPRPTPALQDRPVFFEAREWQALGECR